MQEVAHVAVVARQFGLLHLGIMAVEPSGDYSAQVGRGGGRRFSHPLHGRPLGAGHLDIAVTASNQAMTLLAQQVSVPGEEHQIVFNHFKVLAAQQDPAARDLLKRTYELMHSQANLISDPADRQVYLEQHKLNQEIMAEVNSGRWDIQ